MRKLELTPRLRLLADWVPSGARLADVGTDHAYLPVWLRLHGRVVSAIACDLREEAKIPDSHPQRLLRNA